MASSNSTVHRASELNTQERSVIERWLGRGLAENETISVHAFRPHEGPAGDRKEHLRKEILSQARKIGSRAGTVSESEVDQMIEEAISHVRGTQD